MADFYNSYCLPRQIKLTINVCQLYKVDMRPSPSRKGDIENALKGVRILRSAGIELKAMNEESWQQLAGYANIKLRVNIYRDREKLDRHIRKFLERRDLQAK